MSGPSTTPSDPLVLVVPNFSEGRRGEVIDAIVEAMTAVRGVTLLNRQADPDHNRLDTTLIGAPEAAAAAAAAGARKAVELIDMDEHHGNHPRMGAVDVIPFIPIRGVSMDDCVDLARRLGRDLGETLSLPVYLYERAATIPERVNLADVRRGEYEGLKADVAAGRRLPDFGPHRIGRAGATAVGARPPLVAFNVYLSGDDERAAKDVARRVRERSGGLVHVRAIGFAVPERGCVQVSMNLVDPVVTPPYRALELVRLEAGRYGMNVLDTEIVGLIPQAVLAESAAHYLQLRGFIADEQVIETLVARQPGGGGGGGSAAGLAIGATSVAQFLDDLASIRPTPGGGAAAAVAGAAGAALLAMVARLSGSRQDGEAGAGRMRQLTGIADSERATLLSLADRDSAAFEAVMEAHRLPRHSEQEKATRAAAVQAALVTAAEVPLEVASRSSALLPVARELVEVGNPNALSDAVSAGQILHAAALSALANVGINVRSITDGGRAADLGTAAQKLQGEAETLLAGIDSAYRSRVSAATT